MRVDLIDMNDCENKDCLLEELDRLLDRDPAEIQAWERGCFDEFAGAKADRLVLCGAGGLGRKTLSGLRQLGIEPLAFTDNDSRKWGQTIEGVEIFSPEDAIAKFSSTAIFVITVWGAYAKDRMSDRIGKWTQAGCNRVTTFLPLFWKFPEVFLPYWACDLPHRVIDNKTKIQQVAATWSDTASLKQFIDQVAWRLSGDFNLFPDPSLGKIYFSPPFINLSPDEHFVDCGAFTGDTLVDFLAFAGNDFRKYTALEPDPQNFTKLSRFVANCEAQHQSKIELLPYATHSSRQTLRFSASGNASSTCTADGDLEVQGERLDAIFATESPTFIKLDIEGGEIEALLGAKELLQKFRPIVAVSIYHVQDHLWEIPTLLNSVLTDYNFHTIAHDREGWDLVMYAIPQERQQFEQSN
jgi:FkbM family methyltransferase